MKRILAFFLGMAIALPLAATMVSAADTQSFGQAKWMDISQIAIDATKKDALLANALLVEITDIALAGYERDNHATAKLWYLWNEAGIYMFAEVKDPTPTAVPPLPPAVLSADPATHAWNRESLEIFIEPNNGTEMADAFAYSVSPNNQAYVFSFSFVDEENMGTPHEQGTKLGGAEAPYIDYAAAYDPNDGTIYYLEMFFKAPGVTYSAGQKVGTMVSVDDMSESVGDFSNAGDRAIYATHNEGDSGNCWDIASHWYIELSAESAMPPPPPAAEPEAPAAEEPAPAAQPEAPAPAATAPSTGNAGVLVFVFAFAASGVWLALASRKKRAAK